MLETTMCDTEPAQDSGLEVLPGNPDTDTVENSSSHSESQDTADPTASAMIPDVGPEDGLLEETESPVEHTGCRYPLRSHIGDRSGRTL